MAECVTIGNATLYHGDCLELMHEAGPYTLIVTSPPYNVKKKFWGDRYRAGLHESLQRKFTDEWYEDEMPEADYQEWQRAVLKECVRVSAVVCYNHKVRYAIKREGRVYHPVDLLDGLPLWSEIIWDRGGGPALNSRRHVPAHESIYVLSERPPVWNMSSHTSVWRVHCAPQGTEHPCPFPVEIPARCIAAYTKPFDFVCDPFMGSGSTGIAALAAGRRFVGIELERKYFDMACERISNSLRQTSLLPVA